MTDKREPYSAQTRQTRSALGLSSTTLFIYSLYGSFPNDKIYDHPGQFQIPIEVIGPALLFSTLYFLISFIVSARYDRIPTFSYALSRDIKTTLQSLNSAMQEFEHYKENAPQHVINIVQDLEAKIEKLDINTLRKAQNNLQANTPHNKIVADTIKILEHVNSGKMKTEAVATLRGDIGTDWNNVQSKYAQLEQFADRLESKVTGISSAKNFYLELLAPTAGAVISIILFFLCGINNASV